MTEHILRGERIDKTGFKDLRLIQKPEDFCYGVDAVILAGFAARTKANFVVDLGSGTGIIPIILSHKTDATKIVGVEVQEDSYERALRNTEMNKLSDRIKMICRNVTEIKEIKEDMGRICGDELTDGYVDMVVSNPPYVPISGGLKNSNDAKMIARHEVKGTLEDFIKCAAGILKDKGDFYMVHRPSRLVDIFCLTRAYSLEPKELQLVSPKESAEPNILLLHCTKNGGRELKILDPLYVYDEEGNYTKELMKIYER